MQPYQLVQLVCMQTKNNQAASFSYIPRTCSQVNYSALFVL